MTQISAERHQAMIIDQFSRQAIPFTQVPGHFDAMQILIEMSAVTEADEVLDVACGPGMVACEFARHAAQVTGVDITPGMIEQARKRQLEQKIGNIAFAVGTAVPLPYPDNSFSLVITRYSFHHLLCVEEALAEMIRVCRPGGTVMVADVAVEAGKSAAYDGLEILRDPSHTHALTDQEFAALFERSSLRDRRRTGYGVDIELESQLKASFPNRGDELKLRDMFMGDIGMDNLGINVRWHNDNIVYTVPIGVYAGRKG
jgi:ubiquinone/menaquinone biosynthesis C-methylase UbiE